jgi:hypothetical protein
MKYLLPALLLLPTPVFAQQVNQFAVCTQNQEVYRPGGYDRYGNYVPGGGPLPLLGPYPEIIDAQMTDFKGGLVSGVINRDATISVPDTNFKVLIFPAIRFHKKKHYLVSFQWADNTAKSFDASTTSVSNPQMIRKNSRDFSNTDSVFLMAVK